MIKGEGKERLPEVIILDLGAPVIKYETAVKPITEFVETDAGSLLNFLTNHLYSENHGSHEIVQAVDYMVQTMEEDQIEEKVYDVMGNAALDLGMEVLEKIEGFRLYTKSESFPYYFSGWTSPTSHTAIFRHVDCYSR